MKFLAPAGQLCIRTPLIKLCIGDETGVELIWNLWDEDSENEDIIESLIGKPIMLRKGQAIYYQRFQEYQVKLPLEVVLTDIEIHPRMKELEEWYNS